MPINLIKLPHKILVKVRRKFESILKSLEIIFLKDLAF